MIKIYSHQNIAMVYHLKNVLEIRGIECEIMNERLTSAMGEVPPTECWIELWISDDAKHDEAQRIISTALANEETTGEPWKCHKCGEESEGQFTECWKCGESRIK